MVLRTFLSQYTPRMNYLQIAKNGTSIFRRTCQRHTPLNSPLSARVPAHERGRSVLGLLLVRLFNLGHSLSLYPVRDGIDNTLKILFHFLIGEP